MNWTSFKASFKAMFTRSRPRPDPLNAYSTLPALRSVVDAISDNVAGASWRAYRRRRTSAQGDDFMLLKAKPGERRETVKALLAAGDLVEVPDHRLLELLEDPNDHLTGRAVLRLSQTHVDLAGETFWVVGRAPGSNDVASLWPLSPRWVTPPQEGDRFYRVDLPSGPRELAIEDVLHFKNADPADPFGPGTGRGQALGDELDTDAYAARVIKSHFWNFAMPAGVVAFEGANLTKDQRAELKESLAREHQGPEKAGKMVVGNGKVTFTRLDTSFDQTDLVALRKFVRDFIRTTYGVPPEALGNFEISTKATAAVGRQIMAEQVVQPRMEFWRTELQKRLAPLVDPDVILEYDSALPDDRDRRFEVMRGFRGAYRHDEARELSGHRPDPKRGSRRFAGR